MLGGSKIAALLVVYGHQFDLIADAAPMDVIPYYGKSVRDFVREIATTCKEGAQALLKRKDKATIVDVGNAQLSLQRIGEMNKKPRQIAANSLPETIERIGAVMESMRLLRTYREDKPQTILRDAALLALDHFLELRDFAQGDRDLMTPKRKPGIRLC